MIPAQLPDMTWAAIEDLIAAERVEDDTIEFKSSFKGGADFEGLGDGGRKKAIDSLAREVIAFLNAQGGDLIIGLQESSNETGCAEQISPVENVAAVSDKIIRSLNAVIEPRQNELSVKYIEDDHGSGRGVIVIRVRPSIRAPHRSLRTRECYLRRGSESVAMTMDEMQNLTINRNILQREKFDLLDRQFHDFEQGKSDQHYLDSPIIHIRFVTMPLNETAIDVTDLLTNPMSRSETEMYAPNGHRVVNDVAFRTLYGRWRPILRGMKLEPSDSEDLERTDAKFYAAKRIKESGICSWDFAAAVLLDQGQDFCVHDEWVQGFFAVVFKDIETVIELAPTVTPLLLRIGVRFGGIVDLKFGERIFGQRHRCHEGISYFPDQAIQATDSLNELFKQTQRDFHSLIGLKNEHPYSLKPPAQ